MQFQQDHSTRHDDETASTATGRTGKKKKEPTTYLLPLRSFNYRANKKKTMSASDFRKRKRKMPDEMGRGHVDVSRSER